MKIQEIYSKQQDFFNSNQTKDIDFRITQLRKFKKVLKENEDILYQAIYDDFGKSAFETYISEIALLYHEIDLVVKKVKKWNKKKSVSTNLAHFPARSYIIPEPLGVTLVIGAWNYPYFLSFVPVVSALSAGNTVVLKPSELVSKTSKVIAELINNNFSSDYFCVIEGGVETTTEILEYKFDKIFFTGSTIVGKIIYQAAAKHLTPVTLELGGKSPTFVLADADLKMSAKRIVWSKFLNAGQTCVASDYILVDKKIEKAFLEALKNEIETYYSQSEVTENYVKIINEKTVDRLVDLIDKDKIYVGGNVNREQRFISPTILQGVSFDDEVMKEEIFGPILPVIPFTNLDEAIQQVKNNPKPLACYIFTKDQKKITKLLAEISFGGGCINDSLIHLSNTNLPFGGVGLSGFGSYHGKSGFDTFSHFKSIMHKTFLYEATLKYYPYSNLKKRLVKWLLE